MPLIEWNDTITIGIPAIDAQHKTLVDLINELHEAQRLGRGRDALTNVLSRLISYTRTHFGAEERYMQQVNHPAYAAHKRIHDQFVERVRQLEVDVKSGRFVMSVSLMQFLKSWLVDHIQGEDRAIARHVQGTRRVA